MFVVAEIFWSYYYTVNNFGEFGDLTQFTKFFPPICTVSIALPMVSHNCLFAINTRNMFWFTVTYNLTYAYMVLCGLLFMAIVSSYSYRVTVATLHAVLPLYHWIPWFNELMITSGPNVCHNSTFPALILLLLYSYTRDQVTQQIVKNDSLQSRAVL